MNADTWQRVSDLLAESLELPAEERGPWLDRRCGDDPRLRREVEALLAIDTRALQEHDRPVFRFFDEETEAREPDPRTPGTVGPYELMREIGRGGMASVHLARDTEAESPAPVAVKLLRRGMDSDEGVRHFRREGEMLARLRHPYIAALHGAGTTDGHRPYLVMEYVDGESIDRFCDRRALGVKDRLGLFLKVCEAVTHAHGNLVLHRDLKPSNILVTRDGEPKLLDFGISKWLDPDTALPLTVTATGLRAMTPEYAAPEQVQGRPATVAGDVYSLGVVLYRLLTGRLPFETGRKKGLLQQIVEDEAPRPSSVFRRGKVTDAPRPGGESRRLRRQLKGDLDDIVGKTLRKEPELRYASVEQLAEDVESYLEHRPVAARSGSTTYRLGKALRRHRAATVLGLLVLAISLGALVERERQQRQVRLERDRALAGQEFLVEIFAEADPYLGKDGTLEVGEVLRQGVERIERLDDRPDLQGPLLTVLGEIYLNLGRFEESENLLRRAVEVTAGLSKPGKTELAKAENLLGQLLAERGETDEAEAYLHRAAEHFRRAERQEDLAGNLVTQGLNLRTQGRFEEAFRVGREGADLLEAIGAQGTRTYIVALNNLGFIAYGQGDLVRATEYLERSLARTRDLLGEDHPDMALALNNLASVAITEDRLDDALDQLEQALAIWRRFLAPSHPNLFVAQVNIAALLEKKGRSREAAERLEALLPDLEEALGRRHVTWTRAMLWRARALESRELAVESTGVLEEALEVQVEHHGESHPTTAEILRDLAVGLEPRDLPRALDLLERVRKIELEIFGEEHPGAQETEALLAKWRARARAE